MNKLINPSKNNIGDNMRIAKVLWILISIIILCWIYFLFISPHIFKHEKVEVPNIIGLNEQEALSILHSEGISYELSYIDGNSNTVISTSPKEGIFVYDNFKIRVYVEKPLPSYYESFEGLIYYKNKKLIDDYCLKHNITYDVNYIVSSDYVDGQIINQSKKTDELVKKNDNIVFYVAVSDEYFKMPNLVGLNIYSALDIIKKYNLKYNIIYYDAPITIDTVIYQSIAEGRIIKKGNEYSFDIYVSKGIS